MKSFAKAWRDNISLFKPKEKIGTIDGFQTWVEAEAYYLIQKTIYDFCRARTGHAWISFQHDHAFTKGLSDIVQTIYPLGQATLYQIIIKRIAKNPANNKISNLISQLQAITNPKEINTFPLKTLASDIYQALVTLPKLSPLMAITDGKLLLNQLTLIEIGIHEKFDQQIDLQSIFQKHEFAGKEMMKN